MGSDMQIFKNETFGEIRTAVIDGEPWFVAVDVCRALEIVNSRDALTRIDEDEKGVVLTDTPGGKQEVTTVNEPGLYSLVLGSRKPEAKVFKRWITHEVIPSIRKNGGYIAGQETMSDVELMARALIVAQNVIEEKNRQISGLTEENLLMKPKAEYFDDLVDRKLLTNFRDTAKEFHLGQKRFIAFLTDNGYAYRDAKGNANRYKGGRPFPKSMLLSAGGVDAAIDDDMLNIDYRVLSFETVFFDSMGNAIPELSNGSHFSERQLTAIRRLQRGKRFYISHVKATGPDGIQRDLAPMEVIVN